MKCFYHPKTSAVGTCKNCSRGICGKCAAEAGDSIACLKRCEEKTRAVIKLVDKNIEISGKFEALGDRAIASYGIAAGAYLRSAVWIFLMGVLFLIFGLNQDNTFLKLFGLLCFIGAGFYVSTAYKYKNKK